MFGLKVSPKVIEKQTQVESHKVMMISLSALAAAVPALWLGGCLATRRPAWFLSRQTVRTIRHKVDDFRGRLDDIKERMEDMKDKIDDVKYKAKRMNNHGWFAGLHH